MKRIRYSIKKGVMIIIILIVLLCLSSCKDKSQEVTIDNKNPITLSEYIESLDLPDIISIEIDPKTVEEHKIARVWKAETLYIDYDNASVLLHGLVDQKEIWAVGPSYHTNLGKDREEYLQLFDGGQSFGTSTRDLGGLSYLVLHSGESVHTQCNTICAIDSIPSNYTMQTKAMVDKSDFQKTELAFMPYSQAKENIDHVLQMMHLQNIRIDQGYTLDAETMNLHLQRQGEYQKKMTQDDEGYYFILAQYLDDIPVINRNWNAKGSEVNIFGNIKRGTVGHVFYDKDGIAYLELQWMHIFTETGEPQKLISAAQALETVVSVYSDLILLDPIRITDITLSYVSLDEKEPYIYVPAWIIDVWTGSSVYDEYTEFLSLYVIDAVTGEVISG